MDDCVILREFSTACGRRFGHATLNAPKSLNALSLAMIDRLAPQLRSAEETVLVVLLVVALVWTLWRRQRAHRSARP